MKTQKSHNDSSFCYNTQIWEYPKYKNTQGKYPVIFLLLKTAKNNNWDKAYEKIVTVDRTKNLHRHRQ